jgi:hypothetical protein
MFMKQMLLILFAIAIFCSAYSQNCSHLKNGTYDLVYDSLYQNYSKGRYEILDSTCYVIQDGLKKEYELKNPYDCRFWLVSKDVIDTTKLNNLAKILLKRQPFYDIYKVEGNTYYFVLRVDLHVRIYSGRFIKLEN